MEYLEIRNKFYYFYLILYILISEFLYSDAFILKKNDLLVINSLFISRFNETDSKTGGSLENSKVGSFLSILYFEYGLLNRLTIGGKLTTREFFQDSNQDVFTKKTRSSSAVEGFETFGRFLFLDYKYFVFSFYSMIKFPGFYMHKGTLSYEFGSVALFEYQSGIELGFSMQRKRNVQVYNADSPFFTVGMYYRTNINLWDEVRFLFTLGIPITNNLVLLLKFNKINYFFKNANFNTVYMMYFNGSAFSIAEVYASILFKFKRNLAFEFGYKMSIHSKVLRTLLKRYYDNTFFTSVWLYF